VRADAWAAETLSLPIGPHLTDAQRDRACEAVLDALKPVAVPAITGA
jgi:dTDP-4-amino-4,6-dideoxygalactose transaminase